MGILVLATGALMLLFASTETSAVWVDGLMTWWLQAGVGLGRRKRLVIYLDNGPNNSGRRRQFLKRLIEFADWSGLEIRLVYDPPYHRKYNPIARCWSSLEPKWGGALLNRLKVILEFASRMTWKEPHPKVALLPGHDAEAPPKVSNKEWKTWETRLERSTSLPKYDIIIKPRTGR